MGGLRKVAKLCGGLTVRDRSGNEARYDADGARLYACPKGGDCRWRTDGMHSNEFCAKCFRTRPEPSTSSEEG